MAIVVKPGESFFKQKARAIVHGCNCEGYMGQGVALWVKHYFPGVYTDYKELCKSRGSMLIGTSQLCWGWNQKWRTGMWVFNAFTQVNPGPHAFYSQVLKALEDTKRQCISKGFETLAMPPIGCGLGGLERKEVYAIVCEVFGDWKGVAYWCDLDYKLP